MGKRAAHSIGRGFSRVCTLLGGVLLALPSPTGAEEVAPVSVEFRLDGNLLEWREPSPSAPLLFLVNEGLVSGNNHTLVFEGANGIKRENVRGDLYEQILLLLTAQPVFTADTSYEDVEHTRMAAGIGVEGATRIAAYLQAFKMNYWSRTRTGADIHNLVAQHLRHYDPRSIAGVTVPVRHVDKLGRNLRVASVALDALPALLDVHEAVVGAVLRLAIDSDLALLRLAVLEEKLGDQRDPVLMRAIAEVRGDLQHSEEFFRNFLAELNARQAEFAAHAGTGVLMAVGHMAGASGMFVLGATFGLIEAEFEQHRDAQRAVLAATIEAVISQPTENETAACLLKEIAAYARWYHFDCMEDATTILPDFVVDWLPAHSAIRSARDYFAETATSYRAAYEQQAAQHCLQPRADFEDAAPLAQDLGSEGIHWPGLLRPVTCGMSIAEVRDCVPRPETFSLPRHPTRKGVVEYVSELTEDGYTVISFYFDGTSRREVLIGVTRQSVLIISRGGVST